MNDLMDIPAILFKSTASIITLFIITKLMGRKQISQLSMFDYIVGISIGSIAAQMTVDTQIGWFDFIVAMAVYGAIYTVIAIATVKSIWARKFFEGAPIILIQDGKLVTKNIRRVRYDVNNLLEECRVAGYFDVNDLDMAIMESGGKVSFLPKVDKRPVNVGDMNLSPLPEGLVANVILDGHIMPDNLQAIGKDENWVLKQLKEKAIASPKEILLATCDINDQFNIFLKDEDINIRHCLE